MPHTVPGNELSPEQQQAAKAAFVHRYTGDHTPTWVTTDPQYIYPVQFKDDVDWLAHSEFLVNKDGSLTQGDRWNQCLGHPTFPFGHEVKVRYPLTSPEVIEDIIYRIERLTPDERGELAVQLSRLELLV